MVAGTRQLWTVRKKMSHRVFRISSVFSIPNHIMNGTIVIGDTGDCQHPMKVEVTSRIDDREVAILEECIASITQSGLSGGDIASPIATMTMIESLRSPLQSVLARMRVTFSIRWLERPAENKVRNSIKTTRLTTAPTCLLPPAGKLLSVPTTD